MCVYIYMVIQFRFELGSTLCRVKKGNVEHVVSCHCVIVQM